MGRVAVILGSNGLGARGEDLAATAAERGALVLQRHVGPGGAYTLPHQIDYAASLSGLAEQGCDRVLAVGSVGSLRAELPVGSLVCPHDFIALHLGLTTPSGAAVSSPPAWRAARRRCTATASTGRRSGPVSRRRPRSG
jgi:hypothetical protein